jgi:photosystem II stability/assembly factor-like uncharacterized protein
VSTHWGTLAKRPELAQWQREARLGHCEAAEMRRRVLVRARKAGKSRSDGGKDWWQVHAAQAGPSRSVAVLARRVDSGWVAVSGRGRKRYSARRTCCRSKAPRHHRVACAGPDVA